MGNNARMIVAAASLGVTALLCGDEFHPVVSVTSSTGMTDLYPASRLIQGPGVGFDNAEPHAGIASSENFLWVTAECGYPCDYFEGNSAPVLIFDLGEDRLLSEVSLWSYTNDNSGQGLTLRFATASEGAGNLGSSISFSPKIEIPRISPTMRQSFAFGKSVLARYVEVTVTDNFFQDEGLAGGDRVGLTEVAFAVPPEIKERLLVTAPRAFEAAAGEIGLSGLGTVPFAFDGQPISENYWSAALHAATGDVYFSVPTANRIYRGNLNDDPPVLELFAEKEGAVYHGMAIDETNGLLYALDSDDDAIHVYSMALGSYFGAIGGVELYRPNELVFDRERQWLVVSDSGLDTIQIYSPTGALLDELDSPTTNGVWGLAIDPETGDIIYSSHDRGEIWRWDAGNESASPVLMHSGLSGPRGLGYDRHGHLYCVESGLGQVRLFRDEGDLTYSVAAGGRDVLLFADCDFNGNFLPDDWEAAQENPALARGLNFGSNYDGDAFSDGLEAALGGDIERRIDGNGLEFTVGADGAFEVEHFALQKSNYSYRLLLSRDLVNWQNASVLPEITSGALLYDTWTFRVDATGEGFAPGDKVFARVEVSIQ